MPDSKIIIGRQHRPRSVDSVYSSSCWHDGEAGEEGRDPARFLEKRVLSSTSAAATYIYDCDNIYLQLQLQHQTTAAQTTTTAASTSTANTTSTAASTSTANTTSTAASTSAANTTFQQSEGRRRFGAESFSRRPHALFCQERSWQKQTPKPSSTWFLLLCFSFSVQPLGGIRGSKK